MIIKMTKLLLFILPILSRRRFIINKFFNIFTKHLITIAIYYPYTFNLLGIFLNYINLLLFLCNKIIELRKFIISIRIVIFVLFVSYEDPSLNILFIDSLIFIYHIYIKYINLDFTDRYPKFHLLLDRLFNIYYIISLFISIYALFRFINTLFKSIYAVFINPGQEFSNYNNNNFGEGEPSPNNGKRPDKGPSHTSKNSKANEDEDDDDDEYGEKEHRAFYDKYLRQPKTEEQKARKRERDRIREANLTEEQKERRKERKRELTKIREANLTEEQKESRKAVDNLRSSFTSEEKKEQMRQRRKERKANRTEEEIRAQREKNKIYDRKWRKKKKEKDNE